MTALIAAFLAYHVNWIRRRHEALAVLVVPSVSNSGQLGSKGPRTETYPVIDAPGMLWMFGERGYIILNYDFDFELGPHARPLTQAENYEVERVRVLFPEAKIDGYAWGPENE
jgi:hypothetical protein